MQIIFTSVFGERVNYFNEFCCFRSRCTIDKDEIQLSTSNNDSFDHGSINEEGQGNLTMKMSKKWLNMMVYVHHLKNMNPATIAVLGRICKTKAIAVKDQKRKDVKSSARKKNSWQTFSVGVRNDYKFLKEGLKKQKKRNLIILFLHSSEVWHKPSRSSLPV